MTARVYSSTFPETGLELRARARAGKNIPRPAPPRRRSEKPALGMQAAAARAPMRGQESYRGAYGVKAYRVIRPHEGSGA
jgi:hypothetical protein